MDPGGTPELDGALTNLDNGLEHLVIVPNELARFPGRRGYWARVITRALHEIRHNPLTPDDRQRHALVNWLFAQHVLPAGALVDAANRLVDELGIHERAVALRDAVIPVLNVKEDAVRRCFEHLELPIAVAALKYIDSRGHQARVIAL